MLIIQFFTIVAMVALSLFLGHIFVVNFTDLTNPFSSLIVLVISAILFFVVIGYILTQLYMFNWSKVFGFFVVPKKHKLSSIDIRAKNTLTRVEQSIDKYGIEETERRNAEDYHVISWLKQGEEMSLKDVSGDVSVTPTMIEDNGQHTPAIQDNSDNRDRTIAEKRNNRKMLEQRRKTQE